MEKLWIRKSDIKDYSTKRSTIANTFDRKKTVLEYERKYTSLTQEQLEDLLIEARDNEWQTLDLSNCRIDKLPDLLWEVTSLRVLYIGNNSMDDNYNSIKEIPAGIGKLENLEALSIYRLPISSVSKEFRNLKKLTYLDCFRCEFTNFPNNLLNRNIKGIGIDVKNINDLVKICKIKKLEELFLTWSSIEILPVEIGDLTKLKTLFLANSNVRAIPESLMNSKHINRFVIANTPLERDIPEAMLKQNAYDLICFICKQQKQNVCYAFNESKMIIVGQGNVGKSCLLERITNNNYVEKESTEGIDVKKWAYYKNRKEYTLNIWDFGGQEIYHSTHQFFLTKRSLYIFVWDARAEEEYGRIDYWLKTIESFADDSPIIIVINKCDKDVARVNRIDFKTYKEKYPQIKAIIDISCKDNYNIKKLKTYIKNEASNLPIMKEKWIKSWLEVRTELEELSHRYKYINYKEYENICKKYGIGFDETRSLSKYLHDLGIILNYQDDPLLKGIIILDPQWATSAVYKILDSQERLLKNKNGILKISDLPFIWNDSELYPEDKHIFLLKIMEKFQLCFELNKETYLVAELLENESIDTPKNWDLEDDCSIRLIYKYDFMPAGVMTRFIVKVHEYIATENNIKLCWKKGVYLKYYTAYASVVMTDTISDKKIEVRVSKKNNSMHDRELLHLIRNALNEINETFKKLKVDEYVPCNCQPGCQYQYSYRTLCRALELNRKQIQCHQSFEDVDILRMLEGIEIMQTEEKSEHMYNVNIQNNPVISNKISIESSGNTSQTNTINIGDIKKTIMEIQGDLSEVQEEIAEKAKEDANEELQKQINKINDDLEKIRSMENGDDIVKSGKLNKLRRFLKEFSDENSDIRKNLEGGKNIIKILGELIQKFNDIAKALGINII